MPGNGPLRRNVTIVNPLGLHYRPAQLFSEAARQYTSKILVYNGSNKADGRSLIELIMLVALPGCELTLEVEGDDAEAAIDALAAMLASPGE
jgi:phosphotransferase system HPr (HPr) family protein